MTISKFFIIMTMTNYLMLIKTLIYLDSFLKKCKFDINGWNTTAEIGINNSTETNYSDIIFNREFKFLTRLDIKNLRF